MYFIDRHIVLLSEIEQDTDEEISADFINELSVWGSVLFGINVHSGRLELVYKKPIPVHEANIKSALLAAKQARFEFGESGKEKNRCLS